MSKVKRFHKKEAARILVELQDKTEDKRLMDYRRHLLNNDNNMGGNQNSRPFQERLEQACWSLPYQYTNLPLLQYDTIPIGYPSYPPSPHFWFPNLTSHMPHTAINPYIQSFSGIENPANIPGPTSPPQQGKISYYKTLANIPYHRIYKVILYGLKQN